MDKENKENIVGGILLVEIKIRNDVKGKEEIRWFVMILYTTIKVYQILT